jgi:hypothetical protein
VCRRGPQGRGGGRGRRPRGAAGAALDSILKGVAGQVGGLLWDGPESDPTAADDEDDGDNGTAGVAAPV